MYQLVVVVVVVVSFHDLKFCLSSQLKAVYCVRCTVVPALCDPRRERPPALYGHVINAQTDTFQR